MNKCDVYKIGKKCQQFSTESVETVIKVSLYSLYRTGCNIINIKVDLYSLYHTGCNILNIKLGLYFYTVHVGVTL